MNCYPSAGVTSLAEVWNQILIVSDGDDKTLAMWDDRSDKQICPPVQGYEHEVTSVALARQGCSFLGEGFDRAIDL